MRQTDSCPFLPSRFYPFFLFPICRITTSSEIIPIPAPKETGDCVGSGFPEGIAGVTEPAGRVGDVFTGDNVRGFTDDFSLALNDEVAFRYC